ncbi:MAG TPA: alpha-2-macroglobulin family protein [Chitinophaga sp.]|uniref:alpha-2-macroglobulin family protein n=1 Tax=Chitinophaga sp. TaxID=1869181 RepID=UPI002D0E7010|nr:alpha-2-macroglobulin family protein [Chitinophaga sp.]HVI45492.1 alpha-2-macroglobulin family protein [Chitinophaga sp.]
MRLFFGLFIVLIITSNKMMAQINYDNSWKKVAELEEKGLPQSALEEVNKIYQQAVKGKSDAQQLKALIYQMKYNSAVSDSSVIQNLQKIDQQIAAASGAPRAILQSIRAEMLLRYMQNNRYRLYNRTAIAGDESQDMTTWGMERLNREITAGYQASLSQRSLLEKTDLSTFDPILVKGNSRALRPNLYDLLAHRALEYYKSGESNLSKPADQFELDDPAAFAPAATFAAHHFAATDTASLQYHAVELLQQLIRLHQNDKAALLDIDLERVQYVNQIAVMDNKDELYQQSLENITKAYAGLPGVTDALYMQATWYYSNAQDEHKPGRADAMKKARAICEQAIGLAPKSAGGVNCAELLRQINSPSIELFTEQVNVPLQPFRTLVKYRNISKLQLRVVKVDEGFLKELRKAQRDYRDNGAGYWKLILARLPLKSWEQPLPDVKDYVEHKAEIKIDALPAGHYMIISSVDPAFALKDNPVAMQLTWVSAISYAGSENRYYALDRTSGKPLAGLKLNIVQNVSQNDEDQWKVVQSYVTAADGGVTFSENRNVRFQWIGKNDELFLDDFKYIYNARPGKAAPMKPTTFFFTDRSIYRPGQTVYFKGIVIQHKAEGSGSDILTSYKTTVRLHDANGEKLDTIAVQTNEFGSYSGKFVIPEGRMNGSFRIHDSKTNGSISFQVEEYKRPKFYVEFDNVKQRYRLGDNITATAKALAYSGNNIDGATVKYRVERRVRFPYAWLYYKIGPVGSTREIAHGTTTTDANGAFTVKFPAVPDRSIDPSSKPIFSYVIYADVTDINGETRSGDKWINAGYQSLEIAINAEARLRPDQLDEIRVHTRNLNGTFEQTALNIQLQQLETPKRLLRQRYWEKPDQFVISKDAYVKDFPVDIYKDEDEKESWPRKAAILQKSANSNDSGRIALDNKTLAPGYYELVVSAKDEDGQPVTQKQVFELVDPNATALTAPAYIWDYQQEEKATPGQNAAITLGTSAKDLHVIQTLKRVDQPEETTTLDFSGIKKATYGITEKDRGGVYIEYVFVKDNRFYNITKNVLVPWDNKELSIKLGAHRNKLLPGEKEKWSVQISGYKGEKVAAEMVASMYDASLDAFRAHHWAIPDIYPVLYPNRQINAYDNFRMITSGYWYSPTSEEHPTAVGKTYDELNFFDWAMSDYGGGRPPVMYEMAAGVRGRVQHMALAKGAPVAAQAAMDATVSAPPPAAAPIANAEAEKAPAQTGDAGGINIRKNFQETAFFLPDLRTDKDGNISFEFTVPEALTKWNFQGLSHSKDLAFGYAGASIVTQKELMVQPNAPRFVREGDKIEFTAKVSNLSDTLQIGQAHLELLDATTMQPVDGWFQNVFPVQHFTAKAGQSTVVAFPVQIPHGFNSALLYRITAQASNFSDGEENAIPVLTNSMLVTESLPLPVRGDGKHEFKFEKLLHADSSQTLQQHALTVEYTSNPAWYAVQALPYLMEFPYECAEQVFNRYYANALATHIVNVTPGIKEVFNKWKTTDTAALMSNLQKNEELKSLLLQQTPWVLDAKNEAQQKKNIALLFDLQNMQRQRKKALDQLAGKQLPNGAFPWFSGMWEDRFITQYILAGIGRLQQLSSAKDPQTETIANKAIDYLDKLLDKDYYQLVHAKADLKKQQINDIQIHYLYARSFFDRPVPAAMRTSFDYYTAQAKQFWTKQSRYSQGMIALALYRKNDKVTPTAILKSLKENAMNNKELGMYWKDIAAGYGWYQAPIETQSLLIEAFEITGDDKAAVADMKTWLLKNKQTNNWNTTKATADACYAMLLRGDNWLSAAPQVSIQLGKTTITSSDRKTEAGTGYFKERIEAKSVKADMGNITVTVQDSKGQPSWGAVYWQYFEQLDKITAAKTPLVLEKELFKEVNGNSGPVLTKITDGNQLKIGDKVKVRIILRADRTMEYVHLKDMRAACFEPTNVISSSKWQNGVSYYESTRDASTDFFFSYLPKGTYVFEYTLFVTHQGKFSNGISTAQCMYAPEFSAHSEGLNVKVAEQ